MKPTAMRMKEGKPSPQTLTTSKGSRRRKEKKRKGCLLRACTCSPQRPPLGMVMELHCDWPGSFRCFLFLPVVDYCLVAPVSVTL